jgi:colicin import membrane protein
MDKLQALWKKDPGFVVSGGVHALALVLLLVNFSGAPKLEDAAESVPVEMITTSEMNQIMNGEETAKQLPKPQRRVDKLAEVEEHKPTPPLAEAKKDTPPPPSPEKMNDDPGQDEKPPEKVAALPPPPPPEPVVPTPPIPTPPERPVEKAEAPKPAPRPEPVKPAPPPLEAEAVEPTPPPRPKVEKDAKQEPKPVPVPHPRPVETKEAKVVPPPPPRKPEPAKKTDPKMLDQVAKLLEDMKPPKPVTKQKAGNEAKDAKHNDFSLDKITALLDHEAPQHKASTGRSLAQLASLGSQNSHADKMSPSMKAQLDGWLIDHYRGCWSYFGLGATQDYVPRVRIRMATDGSLIGQPDLLNPPNDPNLRSLADSAIRAVNRCNPMPFPDRFKGYYESWRSLEVKFDPKEMS